MYPMRPQMPAPAQQYGYPQVTTMPIPSTYPQSPAYTPMAQGLGALMPQQMNPMAVQQLPFGQAPVVGMAEGGPVSSQMTQQDALRAMAARGGKGASGAGPQQSMGGDGYELARIMRTGTPEERMAALRQMRGGQGQQGMSSKGQRSGSPQQMMVQEMLRQRMGQQRPPTTRTPV